MAARASRVENQDAIDTAIVGTLADPKEVCQLLHELYGHNVPVAENNACKISFGFSI